MTDTRQNHGDHYQWGRRLAGLIEFAAEHGVYYPLLRVRPTGVEAFRGHECRR